VHQLGKRQNFAHLEGKALSFQLLHGGWFVNLTQMRCLLGGY
jgi:hypothetical protein